MKKNIPLKVEYIADECLSIGGLNTYYILLPKCPTCQKYPTYNEKFCPFCGQELIYPTIEEE